MIYLGKYHQLVNQVYIDYQKRKEYAELIDHYFQKMTRHQKSTFRRVINNVVFFSYETLKAEAKNLYKLSYDEVIIPKSESIYYLPPLLDININTNEGDFSEYHNSKFFFDIFAKHNSESCFTKEYFNQFINDKGKITLFVVDDFSGTGDTILTFIDKLKKYLQNINNPLEGRVNIVILLLSCMQDAYDKIKQYYRVICAPKYIFKKAFSNGFIFSNATRYKSIFCSIDKLFAISGKNEFGYKNSQSLIGMDYATPNNTIKILWDKNKFNFAPILLPRRKRPEQKESGLRRRIEQSLTKFKSIETLSAELSEDINSIAFELSIMEKLGLVTSRNKKYKSTIKKVKYFPVYNVSKPRIRP